MPVAPITYVVLGTRRVQAARRFVTEAGTRLLVPPGGEWDEIISLPSVTAERVAGIQDAIKVLRRLPPDSTLVAGDAPAMAAAWELARRRPDLTVLTEPGADPARRPAPADLAVLTPWYPGPDDDFAGAFVRATTAAVRADFDRILTVHTEGWFYPSGQFPVPVVEAAAHRLAARTGAVVVSDTEVGELARVAVPSPTPGDYATWMDAHVRALRAALPTGRIEAPVIHAHTGLYAGVQAAELARPDARIVVTEHATFLPRALRQSGARRRYARMLDRVDVLLCVSGSLRDYLIEQFPAHAAKIHVVPNPIDFAAFVPRPAPVTDLHRWLYVGRLIEHKNVLPLLEAFALVAADDPSPRLTLVGSGPLAGALAERIAALDLTGRVELRPPVTPERVGPLMREHDLLVHLSARETFGMTVVEAVASGLPVLVAASEGPRETMAGLDGVAGSLIGVTEDPATVAQAYRDLVKRRAELDLPAAREVLRERYGAEAVAARLRAFYFADAPPTPRPAHGSEGGRLAGLLAMARRNPDPRWEVMLLRLRNRVRNVRKVKKRRTGPTALDALP